MIKKRQYYIWQYQLDDLYENDGKLMVNFSIEDAVTTSEDSVNNFSQILFQPLGKC